MFERKSLCAFVAFVLFASGIALGQGYPSKQVRMVVPNPPGGITDVIARLVGQRLGEAWGQPVIVENRVGGGQMIGAGTVARSAPDGYTFLVADGAVLVANPHLYAKTPYDSLNDFTPITILCQISPVLSVAASLPVSTVQELIALAKSKPGALSYGSFGNGTYAHLSMEEFKRLTGIDMVHVPYNGAAPAINDLLAGRIAVMFSSLTSVQAHAKAGKLKIIAAATAKRLALRPDLPTISESGLPGFVTGAWFGMFGPGKLPREVIDKTYVDVTRIINSPEAQQLYTKLALERVAMNPGEFSRYLRSEFDRWGDLIKASGVKVD